MPCTIVKVGDATAIVCTRGQRRQNCRWCGSPSTKLCDARLSPLAQVTHIKTCDAPMCDVHAKRVGPDRDLCPDHAAKETA